MAEKFVGIVHIPGTHIREVPLPPELTSPPNNQDTSPESNNVIHVDFRRGAEPEKPARDIHSVGDVGRLMMVKLQSRTAAESPEATPRKRSRLLGRAAAVLGSSALITTLWTLGSRGAQAYAMARHGMDIGGGSGHSTPDFTASLHDVLQSRQSASTSHHEVMTLASSSSKSSGGDVPDNGVHHYGGVRIEGADYADNSRTAESWQTDKDCAWNWAKQDLAVEAHKAGLTDNQIHAVAHDESAIARVTKTYINSNGSIKNAPHHWLYDGHTYDTDAARAKADAIVHDLYPNAHVEHAKPNMAPVSNDIDQDGLINDKDPNSHDTDTDDDGLMDGKDDHPSNPDVDRDGRTDGNDPNTENPDTDKDGFKDGADPAPTDPNIPEPSPGKKVSWIEAQWNEHAAILKHVHEMSWRDVGNEIKNAWNKFWSGDWLKVVVLGTALIAMRQYERGRQAYYATHGSPWRRAFAPALWHKPRTWRKIDWGAFRHRPAVVEEEVEETPVSTTRVRHYTHPTDPRPTI